MGQSQKVVVDDNTLIFNLFGQLKYGRGKRQLSYDAMFEALEELAQVVRDDMLDTADIYLPYLIGSDNAGGHWGVVSSMIRATLGTLPNNVYIVKLTGK